jgi:hypothetical protein
MLTVMVTFAQGFTAGALIGWMMKRRLEQAHFAWTSAAFN